MPNDSIGRLAARMETTIMIGRRDHGWTEWWPQQFEDTGAFGDAAEVFRGLAALVRDGKLIPHTKPGPTEDTIIPWFTLSDWFRDELDARIAYYRERATRQADPSRPWP
jgi:hypothetical protein